MRPLLSLLVVAILAAFTAGPATLSKNTSEEYCNKRFSFCVQYPSDYFTKIEKSDNGDGVMMHTTDGAVDLQVTGSYNVMDWSIKDIYYHTFDSEVRGDMNTQVIESQFDDTFSQVKLKTGNRLELFRTYLLDNAYVTIDISVPANAPELLEQLEETVNFSVAM